MTHNMYSVLIVVLIVAQTVQSAVHLYYCTFENGGRCDANTLAVNQTERVLRFDDVDDLHINLTCVSTQAIGWVLQVPTEARIEGTEPVIRFQQADDNSPTLVYSLSAQVPLYRFKGLIRCEAQNGSEDNAQVFIVTREYLLTLLGKYDALNFFITKVNGPVIIPCAGTVPTTEKLKLLKTSGGNKVIRSVSEECLKCICYPFDECRTPYPSCAGNYDTNCGYFHISEGYWDTAGRLLPANLSRRNEDLKDWELCVMDYDCAVATVRRHMWNKFTDCNGDGVVTCEDFILIHRHGHKRCSEYLDLDGGSMFRQHRPCLRSMTIEEDITGMAVYDQTKGFILNGTVDENALYICSSSLQEVQYSYIPLDSNNQVPSQMYFNYSDDAIKEPTVSCTVGTEKFESLKLMLASCQSLTQCDLKFRPHNDLGIPAGEMRSFTAGKRISETVTVGLPFHEGIVGCIGLDNNTSKVFKFVRHFDYFFTGLDGRPYFISSELPNSAVLRVALALTNGTKGNTQKFTCRSSTFLAFPFFQFAVRYSDRSVQFLPLDIALTPGPLQTVYGHLSSIRNLAAEAERSLELKPWANVTHVTCLVRLMNSNEWINETLALPVGRSVTEDSYNAAMWTAIGISCALCLGCTVYAIRLKLKHQMLTDTEVRDFFHGDQTSAASSAVDQTEELIIDKVGFPKIFRLPSESYIIDWDIELGCGEYGRCYKGFLRQKGQNIPVAIKTLKNSADKEYFKSFLKEIKVMAHIGEHENVVKFYGAMVERISQQKCHAVMELSPFGNLRNFILIHFVTTTGSRVDSRSPARAGYSTLGLAQYHLINFCEQIAAAMEHITSKKVVHGDLAARNVLVFPNFQVKVTDFGLARRMYESGIYSRMKSEIPLPWRWMAPESLRSLEFSTASDVWSFGLTCWEILTQGEIPFAELQSSQELFKFVSNGNHLPRPACATVEIYDFLLRCWSLEKSVRPSFCEAKTFFGGLLQSTMCDYSRIMPAEFLTDFMSQTLTGSSQTEEGTTDG